MPLRRAAPIALERPSRDGDWLVVHELKYTFRDGTTQFLFEPLDSLARLAAIVSRPRSHLTRYHGVLAPNARHRHLVVPTPPPNTSVDVCDARRTHRGADRLYRL